MRSPGFTLLELVTAMALAGVLAATGLIRLPALVEGARLAGAARTVATSLRLARGRALAVGAAVEVRFDALRRGCETRDQSGAVVAWHPLPAGVGLAALPARGRVLFGGLGTAENATVTLAAGSRTRSVIVNQRGRVRLS
jgi:general secretion pathway protein H